MSNLNSRLMRNKRAGFQLSTLVLSMLSLTHVYAQEENNVEYVQVIGQAASMDKALKEQKRADQISSVVHADGIGQLPDDNAAEALQRIPGVSTERDQGEGRFVSVRGLGADLNSVTINGTLVPAPESDRRGVALDVLPSELVQSLAVVKTLTPDMDANSLGGTVQVESLSAFDHDGLFYMITTNVTHGNNFIVTAENPEGPWSEPYYLGDDAPGIDPSLFFDDDGKCYYCGTRPNPEGVRYNGDWEIWIQELDLKTMKLVGESMAIWKGAVKGCIWPEGPHIYKIDGYYYLLHAEGGTGPEHSITVARSKKLFQWFEGCPRNPIFTHRNLGMDYPVIYAGHGDLVDDGKGNWYVVMLASRPCKKHSSMGRETFLARVIWENGWPVIAPGVGHLEDEFTIDMPEHRFAEEITNSDVIHFWGEQLDQRLVAIEDWTSGIYSLTEREGALRMYLRKEKISERANCAYLGVRQKSYRFVAETGMEFYPENESETAGLVLYQNNENHLRFEVVRVDGEVCFVVTSCIHGDEQTLATTRLEKKGKLKIRLQCRNQCARVWISEGKGYVSVAENLDLLAYTTEEAGGFVGCTVGVYASSNGSDSTNYADFEWLTCQSMD